MANEILLKRDQQRAVINLIGGGIKEYYLDSPGGRRDIVYGYQTDEEKSGSMGDVLFPFPGRVEKSRYVFDGKEHELIGLRIKDGNAIHGFAKSAQWEVVAQSESSATIKFDLTKEEFASKGFPFSLQLALTYHLNDAGLTCEARATNIGEDQAPCGLGFHPYFTVGTDTINAMQVQVNARRLVEFDETLKPTGKYLAIPKELDFSEPRKIGATVIDNCFTDLTFEDGIAKTILSNAGDHAITIWQDQNFPYLQMYSADTIGEEHARKGLAVEPQTCTGYAFNVPSMGLKVLKPGEIFEGKWGVFIS